MLKKVLSVAVLLLTAVATAYAGEWELDSEASSIYYLSTKNTNITETNTFAKLSGNVKENGETKIVIDLDSVNTHVPIRDERLRDILFETDKYKQAVIITSVDIKKIAELESGKTMEQKVTGILDLHGKEQQVQSNLQVTKLKNDRVLVTTTAPIVINASDFALSEGMEKLRAIVNLSSISLTVPVTFKLVFFEIDD